MSDNQPPKAVISRVAALEATSAGAEARRAGKIGADCPWSPDSAELADRFLAHHWRRGYTLAAVEE